jgi:hypothetical protein
MELIGWIMALAIGAGLMYLAVAGIGAGLREGRDEHATDSG